jgi:hypothetical protein
MAKKKKAMQSTDGKEQVTGSAEDLVEEEAAEVDGVIEDAPLLNKEDEVARRMIMRRKLEQYMEERRLKKELGDDFENKE